MVKNGELDGGRARLQRLVLCIDCEHGPVLDGHVIVSLGKQRRGRQIMRKRAKRFKVGQVVRDLRKLRNQDDAWAQVLKVTDAGLLLNGSRFRTFSEVRPLTKRERP